MLGNVFNIQRFSTLDGPGIRTAVYLKGCNLACVWCHNPESVAAAPQTQYFAERCAACGRCAAACPRGCHIVGGGEHGFDRRLCRACGACADKCPNDALVLCGAEVAAGDVLAVVRRDADYYANSGGGATLTGGEPLLQADFCAELLRGCRESGIDTAVDTALNVPFAVVEELTPLVDLWLVDVKHMDAETHRRLTGVSNARILANLRKMLDSPLRLWVRVPLVGGLNDDVANMERLGELLRGGRNVEKVDLLPYHNYGINKAVSLGGESGTREFSPPGEDRLLRLREILAASGVSCPR